MSGAPDFGQARRAFARAAATCGRADALPRELAARLMESLDYYQATPHRVLDIGCGTARGAAMLKRRWRKAEVVALDAALPMLRQARAGATWRYPLVLTCADARSLPFADASFDLLYSNLCLPWCGAPKPLFREFARVLRPDGFLVASSLGPDTLTELRTAWAAVDAAPHVDAFLDMHDLGDAILAAGLKDPVLDTDHVTLRYPDAAGLLADLKDAGGTNSDTARRRGLTGKRRFRAMQEAYPKRPGDGCVDATFEVVTVHAWGFPEGAMPLYGGRDTPFEVISRRVPKPPRQDEAGGA